jgi:hypothetical protein
MRAARSPSQAIYDGGTLRISVRVGIKMGSNANFSTTKAIVDFGTFYELTGVAARFLVREQ